MHRNMKTTCSCNNNSFLARSSSESSESLEDPELDPDVLEEDFSRPIPGAAGGAVCWTTGGSSGTLANL